MATGTPLLYTPEDLLKITDRPMPELVRYESRERGMGGESDLITGAIFLILGQFARERRLGHMHTLQVGYPIFPDDPCEARIQDVSFIRADPLPPSGPAEDHSRTVPDLVVEVIAPNGDVAELFAGIEDFHAVGVPLIWIVDPGVRNGRGDDTTARLTPADPIDADPILPGSRCPVRLFFE